MSALPGAGPADTGATRRHEVGPRNWRVSGVCNYTREEEDDRGEKDVSYQGSRQHKVGT